MMLRSALQTTRRWVAIGRSYRPPSSVLWIRWPPTLTWISRQHASTGTVTAANGNRTITTGQACIHACAAWHTDRWVYGLLVEQLLRPTAPRTLL